MRTLTAIKALSAASTIALLAGCSGGSAISPKPATPHYDSHFASARMPALLARLGIKLNPNSGHRLKSFDACPAKGPIKYVSDYNNNAVNIYVGKFAGQAPCGRITAGLLSPWGMYVKADTHDLYVANDFGRDILVFHRGEMTAYNTYTDPTEQDPVDVTVAGDGTVIATNLVQINFLEDGSISTWKSGPNGGTFVGNFPMPVGSTGLFVTVQKNGIVYYDDLVGQTNVGALYSVSCPAGACGTQTQVAGVSFNLPGGLGSNNDEDVLASEGFGVADTFNLPNPNPKTFPLEGIPTGMAINKLDHHWFVADGLNNDAAEYLYPSGKLVGTVPGNPGGGTFGVAVDPGHAR